MSFIDTATVQHSVTADHFFFFLELWMAGTKNMPTYSAFSNWHDSSQSYMHVAKARRLVVLTLFPFQMQRPLLDQYFTIQWADQWRQSRRRKSTSCELVTGTNDTRQCDWFFGLIFGTQNHHRIIDRNTNVCTTMCFSAKCPCMLRRTVLHVSCYDWKHHYKGNNNI